jgi:nitrite reductase/ring-hydroxylating ferredoxin subunit
MEGACQATDGYVAVVSVDELRLGFLAIHEIAGRRIALAATEAGVTAWDATCPHAEFEFAPMRLLRGCELECPMHGARFHVADGRVLKGPAKDPLEPIEVRIDAGVVMVLVDWLL